MLTYHVGSQESHAPYEKVPSYLQKTCVETFRIINAGLGPNVCVGVLVGEQFEFLEGYTEFLVYV